MSHLTCARILCRIAKLVAFLTTLFFFFSHVESITPAVIVLFDAKDKRH